MEFYRDSQGVLYIRFISSMYGDDKPMFYEKAGHVSIFHPVHDAIVPLLRPIEKSEVSWTDLWQIEIWAQEIEQFLSSEYFRKTSSVYGRWYKFREWLNQLLWWAL